MDSLFASWNYLTCQMYNSVTPESNHFLPFLPDIVRLVKILFVCMAYDISEM